MALDPQRMRQGGLERLISYISMFLMGAISIGQFLLLVAPDGWHRRMSLFYTLDIGLYRVNISHGSVGHIAIFLAEAAKVPDGAVEILKDLLKGWITVGEMTRRMCHIKMTFGLNFCDAWVMYRIGSMAMLILNGTAIFLHGLATGFVYYYWFKKAMPVARKWMWFFIVASPMCYTISIVQYCLLSMDLVDFPPRTQSVTYSDNCMFCGILTALAWLPVFLMIGCARVAPEEKLTSARHELKEATRDADVRSGRIGVLELTNKRPREDTSGAGQPPGSGYAGQPPYSGVPPGSGYGEQPHGPGYGDQAPGYGYDSHPPASGYMQPASYGYDASPQAMTGYGGAPLLSRQEQAGYGGYQDTAGVQPPSWGPMQPPSWGATAWRSGAEPSLQAAHPSPYSTTQTTTLGGATLHVHLGAPTANQGQGMMSSTQGVSSASTPWEMSLGGEPPGPGCMGAQEMMSSTQGVNSAQQSAYTTLY